MNSFIPTPASPYNTPATYNVGEEIFNQHLKFVSEILCEELEDNQIAQRHRVRKTHTVEIVKHRSIETSNEVFFLSSFQEPHLILVRFIKHMDRFYVTTNVRNVMRQVSFDMRVTSRQALEDFILTDALNWLTPNASNVRYPNVMFLAVEDQDKPTSELTAACFKIANARVTTHPNGPVVELTNAQKTVTKRVSTRMLEVRNSLSSLVGRFYVEFFNGQHVILNQTNFYQQFCIASKRMDAH